MGTTTFFLRLNDCAKSLNKMSKDELEKLNSLSPYNDEHDYSGWQVPLELHNGNIYALVFWKGKLMKIDEAYKVLNKKYYDKYRGKELKEYEWTILKKYLFAKIERLDKEFKKRQRKSKKARDKSRKF